MTATGAIAFNLHHEVTADTAYAEYIVGPTALPGQQDPRAFWVFPGNDGTGYISATVSAYPERLSVGSNPDDVDTFTATVPIEDAYMEPLIDYIAFRAYSMDASQEAAVMRAQGHLGAFQSALGIKLQGETMATPKTTNLAG